MAIREFIINNKRLQIRLESHIWALLEWISQKERWKETTIIRDILQHCKRREIKVALEKFIIAYCKKASVSNTTNREKLFTRQERHQFILKALITNEFKISSTIIKNPNYIATETSQQILRDSNTCYDKAMEMMIKNDDDN